MKQNPPKAKRNYSPEAREAMRRGAKAAHQRRGGQISVKAPSNLVGQMTGSNPEDYLRKQLRDNDAQMETLNKELQGIENLQIQKRVLEGVNDVLLKSLHDIEARRKQDSQQEMQAPTGMSGSGTGY